MSCNYADGLSPYENKGVLGLAEHFDSKEEVLEKCKELAKFIKEAKRVVVHTGAGISTSAGIPDFRGPKGVWTLEEKGLKPDINISFSDAKPTKTHMVIKKFIDEGLFHYVVSQNIDGLHLKSGVTREHVAELHGNMFIDQCNICKRQFVRSTPTPTVGQKLSETQCKGEGRPCRGRLQDTILDWEHSLPDDDLEISDLQSSIADLSICLGTTLQILPSGNIPLNTLRYGGKLVICNLQPTKHDNKADLIINTYVDDVMENVARILGITIPKYTTQDDPTTAATTNVIEWTIKKSQVVQAKRLFKSKCSGVTKKRILAKRPNNFRNSDKPPKEIKKFKPNVTPKAKKTPKVKKPTKPKKRTEEDEESVIVINDEDSDQSDVIFIDDNEDTNVKLDRGVTEEKNGKLFNSDIKDTKEMKSVDSESCGENQDNGTVTENYIKNPIHDRKTEGSVTTIDKKDTIDGKVEPLQSACEDTKTDNASKVNSECEPCDSKVDNVVVSACGNSRNEETLKTNIASNIKVDPKPEPCDEIDNFVKIEETLKSESMEIPDDIVENGVNEIEVCDIKDERNDHESNNTEKTLNADNIVRDENETCGPVTKSCNDDESQVEIEKNLMNGVAVESKNDEAVVADSIDKTE